MSTKYYSIRNREDSAKIREYLNNNPDSIFYSIIDELLDEELPFSRFNEIISTIHKHNILMDVKFRRVRKEKEIPEYFYIEDNLSVKEKLYEDEDKIVYNDFDDF